MRCKQFRGLISSALNNREQVQYSESMQKHAAGCAACREYAHSIVAIDGELRDSAKPTLPPGFDRIPDIIIALESSRAPVSDWRDLLWRAGKLSAFAIAAWVLSLLLPETGQYALHVLLIVGASVLFTLSALRPRMSV